ncbi:MAG: hypothetical protein VB051_01465 [Candidatus Pelethousia sp.]|nr:hypothetical protein [Candidatus Pelethousia sp.]
MLLHSTTFEERAEFLYRNVLDIPAGLTAECIVHPDAEVIFDGLLHFRHFLLELFASTAVFRVEDDLESYHRLWNSVLFLNVAFAHGEFSREGERAYLSISKALIKRHFKKPAAFFILALSGFGFYFEYLKCGQYVDDYKKCDVLCICNENSSGIISALSYLARRMPQVDTRKDYAMPTELFLKADYASFLAGTSPKRQDIDPLRADIRATAGVLSSVWERLASSLSERGLTAACNFWTYCTPHWIVHFKKKSKTICIFTLAADIVEFEMALPYDGGRAVAALKPLLSEAAQGGLEALGCIKCGRCDGSAVTMADGLSLCPHETWARRINFKLTSNADAQSTLMLLDAL